MNARSEGIIETIKKVDDPAWAAAANVMGLDLPWLVKAPIALGVFVIALVVSAGVALMLVGIALLTVGTAVQTIFHTGMSGLELLNKALDLGQENVSTWQGLVAYAAFAATSGLFVLKSKKALGWVQYIYDWIRWQAKRSPVHPDVAKLHRDAARLGFELKSKA